MSGLFAQNKDSLNIQNIDISSKKFYYQIGVGYNFSSGIGSFPSTVTNKDGSTSKENNLGSYGKSFDISFGLGKKVTRNLGLEMELGYMFGSAITVDNQYYITNVANPYIEKEHAEFTASTFRINPKFVFEIPFAKENAFYSKIGYLIGFGNAKATYTESLAFDNGNTGAASYSRLRTGGLISGSSMALGVRFKVEHTLSFFVELTGNNLHRTFKKDDMTEAIENGTNVLSSKSVYQTQTVFVTQATTTASPDQSQPYQYPAYRSNYSTVGFRLGFVKHF